MKKYEISLKYKCVGEASSPITCEASAVAEYMKDAFYDRPEQESFWVILLNRKNRVKARHLCTLGTATNSLVHPREVFYAAVHASASAIIICHNHPSGDPTPSAADIQVTRQIKDAAKVMGIEMLDHVIIGSAEEDPTGKGFYSFREAGMI